MYVNDISHSRQATVPADSAQVVVLRLAVAGQVEGMRGSSQIHDEVDHLIITTSG